MNPSASYTAPVSIHAADLGLALGLCILTGLAWVLPESSAARFAQRVRRLNLATLGIDSAAHSQIATLLDTAGEEVPELLRALAGNDLAATMQLLRCHRPGADIAAIEFRGRALLNQSLDAGHGAILWAGHFVHGALATKVALARAGLELTHLSHPRHGFSNSRFGINYLNRLRTRIENRYLRERVMIDPRGPGHSLSVLSTRLRENRLISITARNDSSRPLQLPFLRGAITLAPGAALLALRERVPIHPSVAIQTDKGLVVEVGPALAGDDLRSLSQSYLDWTSKWVVEAPEQWLGWLHL